MSDIFGTGVSGLLSFQRALGTTSHNIANVNTEGYSRQGVDLETRIPSRISNFYVGNGAQVSSIERSYDQFLTDSIRDTNATYSRLEKFTRMSSEIDDLLADPEGGISPLLQEFFSAVQDVSDDPTSGTARIQMLSTSETLVNRFGTFDSRLQLLSNNTEADISITVDEINQLASSITSINLKLQDSRIPGSLSQQSSDLLDTRDQLLQELSGKISIQVINESQNNMTVMIGNGQTLVSGTTVSNLAVQADRADPTKSVIVYESFSSVNDITAQLNGGELGGLLDFRSSVLDPVRNSLGRIAIGIADSFNAQHREGMDLRNNLGGDFFTFNQPKSVPNVENTGTSTVTTTITDVSQLTENDYTLSFDGTNWILSSNNGSSETFTPVAAAPDPDVFESVDGLSFSVSAGAIAGDSFAIRPTLDGAGTIAVAISDPKSIAAAAPIRTRSSLSNLGDIEISQGVITNASSILTDSDPLRTNTGNVQISDAIITDGTVPVAFTPVNLTFTSPTEFTADTDVIVNNTVVAAGTNITYVDGMVIESNPALWQATLTGATPAAGDTLALTPLVNPTTLTFTNTFPNTGNTGTATVSTKIADTSLLVDQDYTLDFDGTDWTLTADSGATTTIVPPAGSFEGLNISISDATDALAGDSFSIRSLLKDPDSMTSTSNVIVDGVAIAAGNPITYRNNMVIGSDPAGWEVTLSGIDPKAKDSLLIEANLQGFGDNRNVLDLSRLQTTGILNNGVNNYQEAYSVLVGQVGLSTHSGIVDRDAQEKLLEQTLDSRSAVSGVNLDEEAADLIKYQQAYEAAARIIQTAQTLFGTLLDATR
jgi:flagellar hook-associated protein 1 FlgK